MKKHLSYKEAGVDIDKADKLVDWLTEKNTTKHGHKILSGIGGFCGLLQPDLKGYEEPVLVASTDGVGTKILLAIQQNNLTGIGQDLVAMCVNDLYTVGAKPLFFLDYYASGVLDENQFKAVLTSIKDSVAQCGAALLGGETAELPGLYAKGHFDLAGFVVGIVDNKKRIRPETVKPGDKIIGFRSSGFHSNGYSLVRKWVDTRNDWDTETISRLLTPTKIYSQIPELVKVAPANSIHSLAHITGGGISGNLPRGAGEDIQFEIVKSEIPTPAWMSKFIAAQGKSFDDLESTFNWGVGMMAIVDADAEARIFEAAKMLELEPVRLGQTRKRSQGEDDVVYI
ncbi:MAG: phosphoribosylformylglycinamidine cyclo-ligase [Oligoflexales bacterium]